MRMTRRSFIHATMASCLAAWGCANRTPWDGEVSANEQIQSSFFCFDTACVVGGVMDRALLDKCVARCQGFEATLSRTVATSDVARINAAGGSPVEVEPETADLIERALDYCRASDGLFDITIGAVTRLWDFHEGVVPSDEAIADALPHVGFDCVHVEGSTVTLDDPDAAIDLGGIAKGYVADVLCDELEAQGVESAFVNLGGNVKVVGAKPDGSPWQVGVRDPDPAAEGESSVARIALEGGSVVTSGLYERQFERDGKRYWHILDPRTGYPVESDIVSATIVSDRSLDGDGYTKPLFMMGRGQAKAWAQARDDFQLLLITEDGTIEMYPRDSFDLL